MTQLTKNQNLIFSSFFTTKLILALEEKKFTKRSGYFKKLNLPDFIKEELKAIRLDNNGSMLMMFYALLVIPKELIQEEFENDYKDIDKFISDISAETTTNYKSDEPQIQYIKHIRNSVAHANISFDNNCIIFNDKYENKKTGKNYTFSTSIERSKIFLFLIKLTEIHIKYIKILQEKS